MERKKETLRRGWSAVPSWVFSNEAPTPIHHSNFIGRVWPKILAKISLLRFRIHDLRHTYASLLRQNGESLAYVRDQLGHGSIQMTVDTYGHLIPGGNKAAVARLDDSVEATLRNLSATEPNGTTLAMPLTQQKS